MLHLENIFGLKRERDRRTVGKRIRVYIYSDREIHEKCIFCVRDIRVRERVLCRESILSCVPVITLFFFFLVTDNCDNVMEFNV